MTAFRYAERAARLLRAARARIRPHRSAAPENAIAAVAEAIARTAALQRRRRATKVVGALAAIGGVVALVAVAPWRTATTTALVPPPERATAPRAELVAGPGARATLASGEGQLQPLPPGHAWAVDERLQTEALPVTLAGADGTTVDLAPRSDLKLLRADSEQWLRLGRGEVALHVAKLRAGQRFVVLTPDAEVEVRGTRFHVALASPDESCGQGTPTRVVVDEGVVVVRSAAGEVRVPAGQRWPAGCPVPRLASAPVATSAVVTRRPPKPASAAPASTLATENDLFGAALRAERSGDRTEAAHLLDALLTRFPQSPLRESAKSARARVTAAALSSP